MSMLPVVATRTTLVVICSFLLCFSLQAELVNVMVGDLTFTRPERWVWEAPSTNTPAVAQFVIPMRSGESSSAEARFYLGEKTTEAVLELWKSYFQDPRDLASFKEERITIGKRTAIYLTMRGTYTFPKRKGR